jgi:hypothetical protein
MSNKSKVTKTLNVQAAESFVQGVQQDSSYYIFAAKHTPFVLASDGGTDNNPPAPQDTVRTTVQVYNDMLFGKRVLTEQVSNMIKRIQWVENTVYDMYRDDDTDLATKRFYVVNDDTVEINVYKCLFNNNGAKSTQKPFGKDLTPIEFPQDGYIWKYMFSVDQFNARKFATSDFIPVVPDSDVTAAAVPGSIEIITVDDIGAGYNNYTVGAFPDPASIAVGSNLRFGLESSASSVPGFYVNCLIRILTGPAAGENRLIVDYVIEGGRKIIVVDRQFNNRPFSGDQYEIFPNVFINDLNGTNTTGCVARAIVNPNSGNSVSRVEVLNVGRGYRLATADIRPANIVSVSAAASISPVISPPGGHGADINNELFAYYVGITSSFSGNSEPLIANNDYRTVGLLKNPLYANVVVNLDTSTVIGSYVRGEQVFRYKPIRLFGNFEVFANSLVIGTNTTFIDTLRNNDQIILTNGFSNILTNVQTIISDTEININAVPTFTGNNFSMYLVNGVYFADVSAYETGKLTLTNVVPGGETVSAFLVGQVSGATSRVANTVPAITINDRDADEFNAFTQITTLIGTFTTPTRFIQDELIVQEGEINTPIATVHSYRDNPGSTNDFLYVTNTTSDIKLQSTLSTGVLRGVTSNAYFIARDKYDKEIVLDSGEILYLENVSPIQRDDKQTETTKLILEFK